MKALKCFSIRLVYDSGAFPTFEQYICKKKDIDAMLQHIGISNIPADPELDFRKPPPRVYYEFKIDINTPEYAWLTAKLDQIGVYYLENYKMGLYYLYNFEFEFNKKEIEESPLFFFPALSATCTGR